MFGSYLPPASDMKIKSSPTVIKPERLKDLTVSSTCGSLLNEAPENNGFQNPDSSTVKRNDMSTSPTRSSI